MSIQSLTNIHTVHVLEYDPTVDEAGSLNRQPKRVRSETCRVKPIGAAQVTFGANQIGQEVDHNLWFDHDPNLTEGMALEWELGGAKTFMRITRVPVDLHGLGRIWVAGALSKREDNVDTIL
jgi:hypothetical protein